jgi:hypothetical protein
MNISMLEYDFCPELVGNIVRSSQDPFSDCVVVKVDREWNRVTLARPYVYVSGANTACPTVLTGVENFEVSFENLQKHYTKIIQPSGKGYEFTK